MHLSVNNRDTSTSILSIKEIIGIVVVFSLVLYLLFPKGDIESLFEGESENTNLSINYLESVLLYHPNNVKLQMILIKNYRYGGEITKALELTSKLIREVEDEKLLGELYKTEYLLNKDIYFQTDDQSFLEKIRENLYDYFGYASGEDGEIDYMFFLGEATHMDFPDLKYIALVGLMEQQPELIDYLFEKEAFELAVALGEKGEAHGYLLRLLQYDEVERELQIYAVGSLLEHEAYPEVSALATKLFLSATDQDEVVTYFNISLHAIVQDENRAKEDARELIELYKNSRALQSYDLHIILTSLLQIGDIEGASSVAEHLFASHQEGFDEEVTNLAVKSLIYAQNLPSALEITDYAYHEFNGTKWLDKSIQLATWLGRADKVIELNIEGYKRYGDARYEAYLLESTTLDSAYAIRGEIYKNRVKKGDYKMLDALADYYNYTGEIPNGEAYFTQLLQKNKHQNIYRHAIEFAYHNGHYLKGLKLYEAYKKRYGIDETLQEQSIKKLLSLKQFTKAYRLTKELKANQKIFNQRRLTDLSWIEKEYPYLYDSLCKNEQKGSLKSAEYEQLILLERAYNQGKRVTYLYEKLWSETSRESYLFALFYQYLERNEPEQFKRVIENISPKVQKSLEKNIHYHMVLANYYEKISQIKKAQEQFVKALRLDKNSAITHQAYLWFLINNGLKQSLKEEITLLRKNPKLQAQMGLGAVFGALNTQENQVALHWINALLKSDNSPAHQKVYSSIIKQQARENQEMINSYTPKGEIQSGYQHLSPKLSAIESQLSYRWQLYKGVESKLSLSHYRYQQKKQGNLTDNTFALSFKNKNKKFLWDVGMATHQTEDNFISASLGVEYRPSEMIFGFKSKYQNKTKETPKLQTLGIENSIEFSLIKPLSQRVQLALVHKQSEYKKQDMTKLGDAKHTQLSATYLLRAGYPDIRFSGYLTHNQYKKSNKQQFLPKDFWELSTQMSVGATAKDKIARSWRPFGSVGLSINDKDDIGTRLSLGLVGALKGEDSLSLSFDYGKGMNMISQPYYGVHLDYRF